MKVLITGFDPFGGESINPAWEAVKAMKDNVDEMCIRDSLYIMKTLRNLKLKEY